MTLFPLRSRPRGFSLVELLLVIAVGALVLIGLQRSLSMGAQVAEQVVDGVDLDQQARYAMSRMSQSLRQTSALLIPTADDPGTDWFEHRRAQSVPATAPTGSSLFDSAVLALALPAYIDSNLDGVADADNDGDGRTDEDWPADATNDGAAGLVGIDDDADGQIDEELNLTSDDETGVADNDRINGVDDDLDGRTDEDPAADMNGDGRAGVGGVDDDNDGLIDEGASADDDEDGVVDEDWLDTQVFYLNGDALIERRSVPWDSSGDGRVSGNDFVESELLRGVTYLRFERLPPKLGGQVLVDVELQVSDGQGRSVTLQTKVLVAGGAGGAY